MTKNGKNCSETGSLYKRKFKSFARSCVDRLVIDHATGLTWQQSGSPESLNFDEAKAYIKKLKAYDLTLYFEKIVRMGRQENIGV